MEDHCIHNDNKRLQLSIFEYTRLDYLFVGFSLSTFERVRRLSLHVIDAAANSIVASSSSSSFFQFQVSQKRSRGRAKPDEERKSKHTHVRTNEGTNASRMHRQRSPRRHLSCNGQMNFDKR